MQDNILVTYASRTGWTPGVAEEISRTLQERNHRVTILPMAEVMNLDDYQIIIAGSALQDRKWLPEAMDFVAENQQILRTKKVATFTVCMTLAMKNGEKYRSGVIEWMAPVRQLVKPFNEGYFAGGLDIARIPFKLRLQFRISVLFGVWKEGDHRNWPLIRTWAEEIGSN